MAQWNAQTLGDVIAHHAELFPQQEALVIGESRLTYGELKEVVDELALGLRSLGIARGDHVAVCMGNTIDWVTFFYAAASIGAVTVPVNTRFKADEFAYCLRQADVKVLVIADRFLRIDFIAMLREVCPAIDTALPDPALRMLEDVVVIGSDVPRAAITRDEMVALGSTCDELVFDEVSPGDVLLMQFTSGTTSYPKGVMLTHDNMLRNAAYVAERFDLRHGDRYYSARPFYHVAGTTLSLLAALTTGACLVSSPSFDAGDALRAMSAEKCTHTSGNDTMFLMILNHPDVDRYPLTLRGGWASSGAEVTRKVIDRMGMSGVCQAYGLSEASPNVSMSWHTDDMQKRIDGWGHVLEGVDVRIVDPGSGKELSQGATGEILVRGWSVMKGYYKMPEQTAKAVDREGWLHTGDLGVMDEEGRLRFITRIKDVFRVGGENVAPAEVEDVLHRHPKIRQAQVTGVPDPRLIEVPAAYIILREDEQATPEEIIEWSKSRMANFRVPRFVKIVDTFENIGMTGSAKVQKNKLRAQALIDFGLASAQGAATTGAVSG
jgi:fatty-acyl-CoA synthase